jgi:ketosteroid isomerase-like protein
VHLVGRPAVKAWLTTFQETWESFRITPERIEAVDGDRILVVGTISAKGRASGVEVDQVVGHVLTLRDGQMVRWDSYADAKDAVEATEGRPRG